MSSNRNESRAGMLRLIHPFVAEVAQAGGLRRRDRLDSDLLEVGRAVPNRCGNCMSHCGSGFHPAPQAQLNSSESVVSTIAFELTSLHKQRFTKVSTSQATGLRHKCVTELLKSSTQLMKRRVANFEWRMAAISGSGAKHATSLLGRSGPCPT